MFIRTNYSASKAICHYGDVVHPLKSSPSSSCQLKLFVQDFATHVMPT